MANQLGRYVWLVSLLRNHGRLTYDEIRQKWEDSGLCAGETLSLRTFHNHRKAIADIFEVDIECDTHGGYKYYFDFYQAILSQCDQIEVIEPQEVREQMKNFTRALAGYYLNDEK